MRCTSLSKRKENFLLLIGFVCPLQCVVLVLFVVCFPTIMTCIVCIACMYWLYTHMVQFLHTPTQEFKLPLPPWGLPWNKIKRMFSKKCDKIKNTLNRRTKLAARLSTSSSKKRPFFGCKNFYRLNRQWQGLIPHVPTERDTYTNTCVWYMDMWFPSLLIRAKSRLFVSYKIKIKQYNKIHVSIHLLY